MLTLDGSRRRQQRLLLAMETRGWDVFLTTDYRTVYYLTGCLSPEDAPTAFALWSGGRSALVTSVKTEAAAETIPLETYSLQRCITDPVRDAMLLIAPLLKERQAKRPAVERNATPGIFDDLLPGAVDASSVILALRKRKEADEVAEIKGGLALIKAAYRAARDIIAPGLTEIDVYNAMYAAVVKDAGTAVLFKGDFACGTRVLREGGPPTPRKLQPGDLYVLDLFPAPNLYFGDTCRTFAVGEPSALQLRACQTVRDALRLAENAIRPGVAARDVYRLVKDFLDGEPEWQQSFRHHAGHGIGFRGHEAPRIIPGSEDVFEAGDVFTLEPGIYTEALQGGIRLEDNYVLGENGLENLFDFPMDL